MRNTRRNIADPISPQNPVIKKDVFEDEDRIQDHLEDKVSNEEIYSNVDDDNDDLNKENRSTRSTPAEASRRLDISSEDESGL